MLTLSLAVVACVTSIAVGAPPLFSTEPYEEARSRASREGKLFIVDATAEWCGPCKQMDRTTWVDPSVVSWFENNAIAVQVDVDHQEEIAEALRIEAMPTVIVFRGDHEIDRVVGGRTAPQLLSWLDGAKEGKTQADVLREKAGNRADANGRVDVRARLDLARALARRGDHKGATAEYVWLWQNMIEHEPGMVGVRGSFMARDMQDLASKSPEALAAFTVLRDESGSRLKGEGRTWEDLDDWIDLNGVIGDDEATLVWIDRVKDDEAGLKSIGRSLNGVQRILIESGRWTLLGRVIQNPVGKYQQDLIFTMSIGPDSLTDEQREHYEKWQRQHFAKEGAAWHAALLAAGRDDEAWKLADVIIANFDDEATRRIIVETALKAEAPRKRHATLVAGDGAEDQALRERVNAEAKE
jgi:thioredoxin 1